MDRPTLDKQIIGNIGLYYVCYKLSREKWNVMPTTRNARGVDIVIYSQDAKSKHTLQVKALTKRSPVPLGTNLNGLLADFFVICRGVRVNPECFVLRPEEVRRRAHRGVNDRGKVSFWLQPSAYEEEAFREAWHRIGGPHVALGEESSDLDWYRGHGSRA